MKKIYNKIKKSVKWNAYVWKYCAKRNPFYRKVWKMTKKVFGILKKIYTKRPFTVATIGMAGIGFFTAGLVYLNIPVSVVIKAIVLCVCVVASGIVAAYFADDEAWN